MTQIIRKNHKGVKKEKNKMSYFEIVQNASEKEDNYTMVINKN